KKRLSHVNPIDRLIRTTITPSKQRSINEIENTSKPKEIINHLKDRTRLQNEICLLIGSVGSGKSTFVDYLRFAGLTPDIIDKTTWATVNLNNAPLNRDNIYTWIIDNLVLEIKKEYDAIDF